MLPDLKPIDEQVVVVVNPHAGIGQAIAVEASRRGACLVLAGPRGYVLDELVENLGIDGCEALAIVASPESREQMEAVAAAALDRFGGFDTWVNHGVDLRGITNGSFAALPHLRAGGGSLVNVGHAAIAMTHIAPNDPSIPFPDASTDYMSSGKSPPVEDYDAGEIARAILDLAACPKEPTIDWASSDMTPDELPIHGTRGTGLWSTGGFSTRRT